MVQIIYQDYATIQAVLDRAGPGNYVNQGLLSLDSTVPYVGGLGAGKTLRALFQAGVGGSPEIEWYIPNSVSVVPVQSFWARIVRRYSPGFTTYGLGSGAAALKIMGWGWSGADNRGTLDITNYNQYQLSAGAGGPPWVIPFVNSADVGQGSQLYTVQNEWTDGQYYQYVIQVAYYATSIRAQAWIFRDGTTPSGPVLTLNAPTDGSSPPLTNRVQSMFFVNQTPMAVTEQVNEGGVEISLDSNPWNLAGAL